MHRIDTEIAEQPEVIARLISEQRANAERIAAAIRAFAPAFVSIAARGTSDNAARYAQYAFGALLRLPVMLATPSLHTLYQSPPDLSRALVIGISQSGRSDDVRQVLDDARGQGALTLAITNAPESPLAQNAAHHLDIGAGEERSVAATKTYTAQLAAMALLTAALSGNSAQLDELAQMPGHIRATLEASGEVARHAQRYRYMDHCVALGRGYNFCTAFEINLKLQELCYIPGHGYSEADFRHGPIAMIAPGFPVVVIAPADRTLPLVRDLLAKLREREAESIVISDDDAALALGTWGVRLPSGIPEWLTPIAAVIPGQVLAKEVALVKGYPVDAPRGLSKVTVTR
jgi:glucosamine--fructose-6-phosphate aminotransferase (isomerizing)